MSRVARAGVGDEAFRRDDQKVISVSPGAKVSEAIKLMLRHRISGLPVIGDKGSVVGILGEGNLPRRPKFGAEQALAFA